MNLNEYQVGVLRTANPNLSRRDARLNAALGLGEAGEVQNIVKKEMFQGHPEDRDAIKDELSDTLYYVAWQAHNYDFSLEEIGQHNLAKLRKRYPDGFDPERSINRDG